MAVSVSKIAVQVTGETAQLSSAMASASKSIDGLSGAQRNAAGNTAALAVSSGRAQMAVSQLTFAVDDAVAVWGQTGFSGALRAAQNNLTMVAMSLGGVKAMMVTVAAVAAIQLVKAFMQVKDAAAAAAEEMNRMASNAERFKTAMSRAAEIRELQKGPGEMFSLEDVAKAADDIEDRTAAVNQQVEDLKNEFDLVAQQNEEFQRDNPADAPWWQPFNEGRSEDEQKVIDAYNERLAAIQRELDHLEAVSAELEKQDELIEQQRASFEAARDAIQQATAEMEVQQATQRQMAIQQEIERAAATGLDELDKRLQSVLNPKEAEVNGILEDMEKQIQAVKDAVGAGILDEGEADAILQQIQEAAGKGVAGLGRNSDISSFSRLPGLSQIGSSAAVSTINSALGGSRNMQDQQRLLQNSDRQTKALERIEREINKARDDVSQVVPI